MDHELDQQLEAKFFGAELRIDLPKLDLHPPIDLNQAETAIDQFLYTEARAGEGVVSIVYGGGKGVMKNMALEVLKRHPLVEAVRDKSGHCLVALENIDI